MDNLHQDDRAMGTQVLGSSLCDPEQTSVNTLHLGSAMQNPMQDNGVENSNQADVKVGSGQRTTTHQKCTKRSAGKGAQSKRPSKCGHRN